MTETTYQVSKPRAYLRIHIDDPADLTTEQCEGFKRLIMSFPGNVAPVFHVMGKVLVLPATWRVHIGPKFLKALKDLAGASWHWEVAETRGGRADRRRPPPPVRPTAAPRRTAPPPVRRSA